MAGRHFQRIACKHISRPGAGESRHHDWIDSPPPVDRHLGPDEGGVRGGAGWIVSSGHIDLDIAETVLRQMRLESSERLRSSHVGHQPKVDLGDRFVRQYGLASWPGISANQALDVDCW